jgi:hypothetical protein
VVSDPQLAEGPSSDTRDIQKRKILESTSGRKCSCGCKRVPCRQWSLNWSLAAVLGSASRRQFLPRLGQGAFRVIVTDVYQRQCALTNSHVLHVLDAAHIRPYADGGSHSPSNGLLLRQDVHTLFDRRYLTVSPDYHVEVSRRLKDEFDNGTGYYALQGKDDFAAG